MYGGALHFYELVKMVGVCSSSSVVKSEREIFSNSLGIQFGSVSFEMKNVVLKSHYDPRSFAGMLQVTLPENQIWPKC